MAGLLIGVIGSGKWGKNLIRVFAQLPESEVTAICDANPDRLSEATALAPGARTVTDYDDVLSGPVDAVVIATPPAFHFALARDALQAGKAVFVEKPMTLSLDDAEALARTQEQTQRPLMVGHLMVYHPAVRRLKQAVEQGLVGEVQYVTSIRTNHQPANGSTALWDFAPHDLSMAWYVLGMKPKAVRALANPGARHPENAVFLWSYFRTGVFAQAHLSWQEPDRTRRFAVVGARGTVVFDDMAREAKLTFWSRDAGPDSARTDGDAMPNRVPLDYDSDAEPLELECRHFLEGLGNGHAASGAVFSTDLAHGLEITRIIDAATRSLRRSGELEPVNGQ